MANKIKIGVIGAANIAIRSVIPSIASLPDYYQLVGIASRSSDNHNFFLEQYNCIIYDDYENLLNDDSIDAVYIPLPNGLHAEWIEKSLKSGKHVLVEKSLGCTLNEVVYLNCLAKDLKLVLFENFQFRFHPQTKLLIDLLNNEEIGEIRCLRASFGFPPFSNPNNIRYNKKLGGGALLDAGAYTTKISQIILGYDLQVSASSLCKFSNSEVEICGGAYLQDLNTGVFAELAFGFDNYYQCGVEIWGSKGKLITNRLFTAPSDLKPEIIIENNFGKKVINVDASNHFNLMLMHFHNLVQNKINLDIEYLQNIDQARLLFEIKKNAYVK